MGGSNSKPANNGNGVRLLAGPRLQSYRGVNVDTSYYALMTNAARGRSIGSASRALGTCGGFRFCPK